MSRSGTVAVRARSRDTLPRASVEESWMDVRASAFEVRRDLGRAYRDLSCKRDPREHLFSADNRLIRIEQHARRHAAEAAGITFISPGQQTLPLPDGCGPDGGAA